MKKLLNKRGSVLFLVVVVMALLLVAASATYYVVRNQHISANTHYANEQSYQVAYSVSYSLKEYFTEQLVEINKNPAKYAGSLFEKMWNATGPLEASNDLKDFAMGEFDVTINMIDYNPDDDGKETKTFDVTVTSDTNGETTTMTQVWTLSFSEEETEYFTRFLTSTGEDSDSGDSRDVFLSAHKIFGDAYFENEYTSMGNANMNESLYSLQTLVDSGLVFKNASDKEIVVAGNYYIDTAGGDELAVRRVMVGNDFTNAAKTVKSDVVFVCGDMHWSANQASTDTTIFVKGDCYLNGQIGPNTTVYVGGDLYVSDKDGQWWNCGKFYVNGNVYVYNKNGNFANVSYNGSMIDRTSNKANTDPDSPNIYNDWGKSNHFAHQGDAGYETFNITAKINEKSEATKDYADDTVHVFADWADVEAYVSTSTKKGTYLPWNAESYFNNHFPDAPTLDLDGTLMYTNVIYGNNDVYSEKLQDTAGNPISGTDFYRKNWGPFVATINKSFKMIPCTLGDQSYLVIDASAEDIYVYLDANGSDTFSFFTKAGNNIIIEGTHSVVFVLPDGKNFNMVNHTFIGHMELARYFTGLGTVDAMWGDGKYVALEAAGKVGNDTKTDQTYSEIFMTDPTTGEYMLNTFTLGPNVHNNIFLVSNGTGTHVKFDGQFTFCGYLYTPHMLMDYYCNTSCFSFIGGMIVGSYYYESTQSTLAFVDLNPLNVVTDLMSEANSGSPGPDPDPESSLRATFKFLGYR